MKWEIKLFGANSYNYFTTYHLEGETGQMQNVDKRFGTTL